MCAYACMSVPVFDSELLYVFVSSVYVFDVFAVGLIFNPLGSLICLQYIYISICVCVGL